MNEMLLANGMDVTAFGDTRDALEHIRTAPSPDLIVVDLYMPTISGWYFSRLVRSPEFEHLASVPILAVSSILEDIDIKDILASYNVNGFLCIPCDPQTFLETVTNLAKETLPAKPPVLLIVDDDESFALLLRHVFSGSAYEAISVKNGAEAIAFVRKTRPDTVLMDQHLQDTNGIDLIPIIKSHGDPVIVVMTGDPDPNLAVDAARSGAHAYARKPFRIEHILDLINKAHRERALARMEEAFVKRTRALQESNARYLAIIEDQTEMICRFLADGTLTFVNDAYCGYFGKSRDELLGSSFLSLVHPGDRERVSRIFLRARPEIPVIIVEEQIVINDERIRWHRWSNRAVLDDDGAVVEYQAVGLDITERKEAEIALRDARNELEIRVKERTSELQEAFDSLSREITQRKRAEEELLNVSIKEQCRIGRELHDSLGQQISGVAFIAKTLEQQMCDRNIPEAADTARDLVNHANSATRYVRDIARGLSPFEINTNDLSSALEELSTLSSRVYDMNVSYEGDDDVLVPEAETALNLYRIAQEAVRNAARHSNASEIGVYLTTDSGNLVIEIVDNGCGFDIDSSSDGLGIYIMRTRAQTVGAQIDIESCAGKGTTIRCSMLL